LPAQVTRFVGRERELVELVTRLRTARLVTVTGTGGCGKTRLALQVASECVAAYPDGAWLVELAGLADASLVPQAVAAAVGVREVPGQPVQETLLDALRDRQLLLVLDNCEHLIEACAVLADAILRTCAELAVLATSREPLGLVGEVAWRISSLTVPPPDRAGRAAMRPADLALYESVRLFVDRAVAAQPRFTLTVQNAAAVAQICRRLDGIPLAIELGARRVTALSAEQIAERLDRRFHLLTGGSRAALPRQQTLAATVEWSYTLLSEPERVLFDRLSVFTGGFSLEAAEAVAGVGDDIDTLDLLTRLVEKSLVMAEVGSGDEARYRMLETLRQYGRECLVARGELGEMQHRHAMHYATLAGKASEQIMGAGQTVWLDRLDRDHDNLHAAVRWAIEHQDGELGLRLAASLSYFWYFRGHHTEGRVLRAAVLALSTGPELATLRVAAIQGEGLIALVQGDYAAARTIVQEGVAIGRRSERALLPPGLATLGFVARVQDDYDVARAALVEAIGVAREVGDNFYTGMALHHLGLLSLEADRDLARAQSLNEEALAIFRRLGNRRMAGVVVLALGRVAQARRDLVAARTLVRDALTVFNELGELGMVPMMVCIMAGIDADVGDLERAIRLASAAAAANEAMGTRTWPFVLRQRDAWLAQTRGALGEQRFGVLWTEGQALSLDRAVASALESQSLD
jgi:non-specific serine/threonine protein kinase